jgi:hypothetical protein
MRVHVQTPYSYESADQAWSTAAHAVDRACRYLAYSHCKESKEGDPILSAAAAPQWWHQGVLHRTHIVVGDCVYNLTYTHLHIAHMMLLVLCL